MPRILLNSVVLLEFFSLLIGCVAAAVDDDNVAPLLVEFVASAVLLVCWKRLAHASRYRHRVHETNQRYPKPTLSFAAAVAASDADDDDAAAVAGGGVDLTAVVDVEAAAAGADLVAAGADSNVDDDVGEVEAAAAAVLGVTVGGGADVNALFDVDAGGTARGGGGRAGFWTLNERTVGIPVWQRTTNDEPVRCQCRVVSPRSNLRCRWRCRYLRRRGCRRRPRRRRQIQLC